jgi:MOSC domain-containing protein YiiM
VSVIERIFTRSATDGSTHEHQAVRVVIDAGIEGDRYFDRHEEPGQNITLIEAEEIERFISEHSQPHDLSITGRNLVTRGVRLNELVGKEFKVGAVLLRGVELCEPCLGLGQSLATTELTPALVVKSFVHRAGLRADVLSTGSIAVGAAVAGAA